MARPTDLDLDPEQIVTAAVEIFNESGLDAVSMRSVSSRLGVSPIPLYSRIGNKDALVDAMADRLLSDIAPPSSDDETWKDYAARWARQLRRRLGEARDSRLILSPGRSAYVTASRPLIEAMRNDGFATDAAVQACRLLTWATVGFGAVESGAVKRGAVDHWGAVESGPAHSWGDLAEQRRRPSLPGGDPEGVDGSEADALFDLHVRYLLDGIDHDRANEIDGPAGRDRRPRSRR